MSAIKIEAGIAEKMATKVVCLGLEIIRSHRRTRAIGCPQQRHTPWREIKKMDHLFFPVKIVQNGNQLRY